MIACFVFEDALVCPKQILGCSFAAFKDTCKYTKRGAPSKNSSERSQYSIVLRYVMINLVSRYFLCHIRSWEDWHPFKRTLDVLDRWTVHNSLRVVAKTCGLEVSIKESVGLHFSRQRHALQQTLRLNLHMNEGIWSSNIQTGPLSCSLELCWSTMRGSKHACGTPLLYLQPSWVRLATYILSLCSWPAGIQI